jgi:hypothetical protein
LLLETSLREQKFLALLYIQRAAKNPLFEAISLLVPMGPLPLISSFRRVRCIITQGEASFELLAE